MRSLGRSSVLLLVCYSLVLCASDAYTFNIGGRDGWTLNPSESYDHWSQRMRFLVNDTLHFRYDNASDSVLLVNKSDYDGCNSANPIASMTGGDSRFTFHRSGPFYFITGNKTNCDRGLKMLIVVLAVRNKPKQSPPLAASPSTALAPSASPVISPSASPAPSASPVISPSASPAPSSLLPGGNINAPSPGMNPADVSAPPPAESSAGLSYVAPSSVSLVVMSLVLGWFF